MAEHQAKSGLGRRFTLRSKPAGLTSRAGPRSQVGDLTPGRRWKHANEARKSLRRTHLQFEWADAISPSEWATYRAAIKAVRDAGVPFLLGGGFALASFTGRWRDTKDIDFYIRPRDRGAAVAALTRAGFADYFSQLPYDRKWIYRSVRSSVIVDMIWSMANQRAQVDELWFERAGSVSVRGEDLRVVPMEEFIWCKLYILQRDHCDWTDIFNLLFSSGSQIDWSHLIARLGEDIALLKGVLMVYGWLCPRRARDLPDGLWRALGLSRPAIDPRPKWNRIRLLDSRAWFAALQPRHKKLQV
jgi:putative nucleotidyltransferase-like protein